MSSNAMVHSSLSGVAPNVIDKTSPVPLHYQLERFLREGIENGRFPPQSTLPTEQELQEHFDLSRTPIRQAIGKLVTDGIVVRRRSHGTVVMTKLFEEDLQSLSTFTEEVTSHGQEPHAKLLQFSVQMASRDESEQLGLSKPKEIFYIRRLRYINTEPVGLVTSRVPVSLVPDLKERDFHETGPQQSFYYVIEKVHGLKLVRASEVIDAVSLDEANAALLEVPPLSPILSRTRITYTPDGNALALENGLYRVRYRLNWKGRGAESI